MRMITCWGSPGRRPKPNRSRPNWPEFLRETLKLELNQDKTLITHARTSAARFLGYQITVQHSATKLTRGQRSANGRIALRVPPEVITAKCAPYRRRGKPWHRSRLQNLRDYDIVRVYGAEYRGIVNYYRLAVNIGWLALLQWNAETSMLKTLAAKHKSSVTKMAARYKAKIITADGLRTCFEARVQRDGSRIQERDSRYVPADAGETGAPQDDGDNPGNNGPDGGGGPGRSGPDGGSADGGGCSRRPSRDTGPSVAALVNITVPWSTAVRESATPADVAGFGLVDAADAHDLLAAAARDPRTRWCVTALHPDGTAAAHGCAAGRHRPPGASNPTTTPGPDPPCVQDWIGRLRIRMTPIAHGTCSHDHAEAGYRPSRKLQHLITVRNARCTAPGCGRPAARCDLDHTVPWDQGGITCQCDLAPLCRHHHRCKQAEGWRLEQPEPGVLIWHTPAGRTYVTRPTRYPQ